MDNGGATIVANNSNTGEVLAVSTQDHKEDWILDSGCTFHMCPTRDWFKEYKEIDGGKVLMGNNIAFQIIGIGNISIRMFDGSVKILSGVRNVPNLHRNLISIGALDEFKTVSVYLLKSKDETFIALKNRKNLIENQSNKRVKVLRTDNGLEFCNVSFDDYCKVLDFVP
ncbi:hypothetical protein UlMin_023829 [Ulmus minor]